MGAFNVWTAKQRTVAAYAQRCFWIIEHLGSRLSFYYSVFSGSRTAAALMYKRIPCKLDPIKVIITFVFGGFFVVVVVQLFLFLIKINVQMSAYDGPYRTFYVRNINDVPRSNS